MSITATTLSAAVTSSDTLIPLASTAAVSAPNGPVGGGSVIQLDQEIVTVTGKVVGSSVPVARGEYGSTAQSHGASCPALVGVSTDFSGFRPGQAATVPLRPDPDAGIAAPVASATTITASGSVFHVTGTTATATITRATGFTQGKITVIADGIWTWTTAGNIAVAGTVTTAGSSVDFIYDAATSTWYPSRLA